MDKAELLIPGLVSQLAAMVPLAQSSGAQETNSDPLPN
jgi:hypothetical protein